MALNNHRNLAVFGCSYTLPDIERSEIGDARRSADHVRCVAYRVEPSDVDLPGDFDGVIDLDAEISNGAFDLRMPEQKLNRSEVASPPADQHRLRATKGMSAELGRIDLPPTLARDGHIVGRSGRKAGPKAFVTVA